MGDNENDKPHDAGDKPVNVDPRCIQEALRMYFQPVRNEDPHLDFYTMYKREATEYDTEYMKKYNEDLNTTLIFAGLFSAVSSAFVIDVQSKLEPAPSDRSEAYLRAILLSLNPSIVPNEHPVLPPMWNGPPTEIITTSDLLYSSLLMSLLAAFVAMLGKQWLNRYLRHTGGSMVERCGDRQRKFDGLEKWPFLLFIESLSIMLQIALLLLTCGLARYMWSINTSVARVIIFFTILGTVFYIGILIAGTSSYECPFQTPATTALRGLKDSGTAQKLLAGLSPLKAISLAHVTLRDTCWGIVSISHHVYSTIRDPPPQEIFLSGIVSSTRRIGRRVGVQSFLLLLRINRASGNAKRRLVQGIQRLWPTTEDAYRPLRTERNGPGLVIPARNLEALRNQNADNARCVCWVLRNITDPEAIDSAIRLAGTIRWFDGDLKVDPPYDLIVSTFEACFDSTGHPSPGMRDRAYFSGRAILQINAGARLQSQRISKYHSSRSLARAELSLRQVVSLVNADLELEHVISMVKYEGSSGLPYVPSPLGGTSSHTLWMSNLFVDLVRPDPVSPTFLTPDSHTYHSADHHQSVTVNILLAWYIFLGGYIEEEAFWSDRSDSLKTVLSHLSRRLMDIILNENRTVGLHLFLEFLTSWVDPPAYLTSMAYEWCSAIARRLGKLGWDGVVPRGRLIPSRCKDPLPGPATRYYVDLLFAALEVGFRRIRRNRNWSGIQLNHSSHHERVFDAAFSALDDEVVADAMCVWIVDRGKKPVRPGPCVQYLARCAERDEPFSPGLRRMIIDAIELTEVHWELRRAGSVTVRLLNHLEVDVDDITCRSIWVRLLERVMDSWPEWKSLSPRCWWLLEGLVLDLRETVFLGGGGTGVVRSLEEAEDWERLEVWLLVLWSPQFNRLKPHQVKEIERATVKLLVRRPSGLPRFEGLLVGDKRSTFADRLQRVCERMRAERFPSSSLSSSASASSL